MPASNLGLELAGLDALLAREPDHVDARYLRAGLLAGVTPEDLRACLRVFHAVTRTIGTLPPPGLRDADAL